MHAILQSEPLVHKVQVRLNDGIDLMDDLDETLAMLDFKMCTFMKTLQPKKHTIRLELQTWNNGKLMAALEGVLARLDLLEDTQDQLEQMTMPNQLLL